MSPARPNQEPGLAQRSPDPLEGLTSSTYERGFRQAFAHAILEYCVLPAKQDVHKQGLVTGDSFCFCLADMAHLSTVWPLHLQFGSG